MTAAADLHSALQAYAARHGLAAAALRSGGSLSLRVDGRYRVQLRALADHRIVITARLLDLAGRYASPQAAEGLQRLALLGAGMLREHASTLCLDAQNQALLLQETVAADADVQRLETAIAGFVNALGFWRRVCSAEPSFGAPLEAPTRTRHGP